MIVYKITDLSLHGQQMNNGYYVNLREDCNGIFIVSIQQLNYMLNTWPDLIYEPIDWCEPCWDEDLGLVIQCPNDNE